MIEQRAVVESAVHKRLHAAQSEEFQLLKQCFRENPGAFVAAMKRKGATLWNEERFIAALDNADIVPMADPNTPSHMHRLMKAVALVQLNSAFPGMFNPRDLIKRVGDMARIPDIEQVLNNSPGGTGMSPEIELQLKQLADKAQERQARAQEGQNKMMLQHMEDANEERQQQHELLMQHNENLDEAAERQSRTQIAEVGFREALVNAHAEVAAESIRARSEADSSDASVKVAQHGVSAAKHGVEAAKHQARAKATAAKKPPGKPKSKA